MHWQGVGEAEMKAGDHPVIGMTETFKLPGIYTLEVTLMAFMLREGSYAEIFRCTSHQAAGDVNNMVVQPLFLTSCVLLSAFHLL